MKKLILALIVISTLTACAAPIGKLTKEDFHTKTVVVDTSYQATYRAIRKGFDACDLSLEIDAELYTDIQEARMVIYSRSILGGRGPVVVGLVEIKPQGNKSKVSVGVRTFVLSSRSALIMSHFLDWANGKMTCE